MIVCRCPFNLLILLSACMLSDIMGGCCFRSIPEQCCYFFAKISWPCLKSFCIR